MRAIILAGGAGIRLRPVTGSTPKPLVQIGGEPILGIVLRQLARHGFTRATLAVNHLASQIIEYVNDGRDFGLAVDYSLEQRPLGTAGPLTLIEDLPEHFLVMNGDVLCDLDLRAFLDEHIAEGCDLTIASSPRSVQLEFGVLVANQAGRLLRFDEKPVHEYQASMGIYAMRRSVIAALEKGAPFGFDQLLHQQLAAHAPVAVRPYAGFWLDIGRPSDYARANAEWPELRRRIAEARDDEQQLTGATVSSTSERHG